MWLSSRRLACTFTTEHMEGAWRLAGGADLLIPSPAKPSHARQPDHRQTRSDQTGPVSTLGSLRLSLQPSHSGLHPPEVSPGRSVPGGSAGGRAHADGRVHGHEERKKLAPVASSISASDATHAHTPMLFQFLLTIHLQSVYKQDNKLKI